MQTTYSTAKVCTDGNCVPLDPGTNLFCLVKEILRKACIFVLRYKHGRRKDFFQGGGQ